MSHKLQDADANHWVYRIPEPWQSFFQLARYDRPIGYWLLALPGWIGLAFAIMLYGFAWSDFIWAILIFLGAIAMRGAGCTYNDMLDRHLDAQVTRTACRPLPSGRVNLRQTYLWLCIQCLAGLLILLCLPRFAQITALCALPFVWVYPFMKRITWWPQLWLGVTFNWSFWVAFGAKTGHFIPVLIGFYVALVLWTLSYDTLYACQDMEDDALIGIKSTARLFSGALVRNLLIVNLLLDGLLITTFLTSLGVFMCLSILPFAAHRYHQIWQLSRASPNHLALFKSNRTAALLFILTMLTLTGLKSVTDL